MKLTRLFLIKAGKRDFKRTFVGVLIPDIDNDGTPIYRSNVVVNEGKMWSVGNSEQEVGANLDDICLMKLDFNLHSNPGKFVPIAGISYSLN